MSILRDGRISARKVTIRRVARILPLAVLVFGVACNAPGSSHDSIQLGFPFVRDEFARTGKLPSDDALTKEIFAKGNGWKLDPSWRYRCKWIDRSKGEYEIEVSGPNLRAFKWIDFIDPPDLAKGLTHKN